MKRQKPIQTTEACAAVSPELSPAQLTAVRTASLSTLRAARRNEPRRSALVRAIKAYPTSLLLTSGGSLFLMQHALTAGVGDRMILLPFFVGNLLIHPVIIGCNAIAHRGRDRALAEAPHGYVLREELALDAANLLTRAQNAARAVLNSSTLARDIIDRQRFELTVPDETWQIAVALAAYSSHVMDTPHPDAAQNDALQSRFLSITNRVIALEELAARVADHDARGTDGTSLMPGAGECFLDLQAGTAEDELAVNAIGDLAANLPSTRDATAN
jgi:hypothetical protein